ncbi:MAG: hypothetical protein JWN38_36 [Candidatus Saccharibacteria bacterium]|nr:hypothetical protein [Candidatus Saccharibacteria bacterium]
MAPKKSAAKKPQVVKELPAVTTTAEHELAEERAEAAREAQARAAAETLVVVAEPTEPVVQRRGSLIMRAIRKPNRNTWHVVLAAVLIVATQLTLIWANTVGLYLNILTLIILSAAALWKDHYRKLGISLAVLPVAQMVSSTIVASDAFRAAAVFYGAILILTLAYRYLFTLDEPVEFSRLNLKGYAIWLPMAVVLGEVGGLVGFSFLRHQFPFRDISLPLVAAAAVVFAITEEMFMRGLIQPHAAKVVHPYLAAALTAVLYAVLSISHASLLTIGPAIIMGIVLAVVYTLKRNIVLTITINALTKLTYIGLLSAFVLR